MTFAERVECELAAPDAFMREALREVDRLTPAVPPVAVPEPAPPTLMGGNSVWRAPPAMQALGAQQSMAAQQLAALSVALGGYAAGLRGQQTGMAAALHDPQARDHDPGLQLFDENREVHPINWFWPYVQADLGAGMYLLRDQFGAARVSREWLELYRNDIVQAMRRL